MTGAETNAALEIYLIAFVNNIMYTGLILGTLKKQNSAIIHDFIFKQQRALNSESTLFICLVYCLLLDQSVHAFIVLFIFEATNIIVP